jgi:hypothetical protein
MTTIRTWRPRSMLALVASGLAASTLAGCADPLPPPSPPAITVTAMTPPSANPGPLPRSPTAGPPPGQPAAGPANRADAVNVAAHYVSAVCPFDWREPYDARLRRGRPYLTTTAARRLDPTPAGRAGWNQTVVRDHLAGTCLILAAQALTEAPNTADRRYVRVVAQRSITQAGGPPAADTTQYGLLLLRTRGTWLVDAPSQGG